jgi:lantibiotic modifying enzyme
LDTLASSIDCGRWYLQHLSPEATTAGAFTGWFSLVYASIECGLHLEDSALIEQASSLANEFPAERIDESGNPDFLAGLSGVICVLLHLESRRTSDDAVRLALRCAERIRRLPKEKGGWRVPGLARPPQGAAHGQSGIAIALTRLHAITGETWLRTMVEEMLAYERSSFDPLDQDWPDLVAPADEVRTMIGWCRGAPGMGLMRIELADHFLSLAANDAGGLRLRQEMEIAVSATRRNLGAGSDHLCCGMAGQLWALNSLAKSRQDDDLLEYIRHRTRRMLSVYRETQTWKQGNIVEGPIIPSLMSGISGIGLTLLELAGVGKISQPLTLR